MRNLRDDTAENASCCAVDPAPVPEVTVDPAVESGAVGVFIDAAPAKDANEEDDGGGG